MMHRILLVDDDENLLRSVKRGLRSEGYEILCASSVADAVKILAKTRIDVVISDQSMPGTTGTQFLAKVRQVYPDTVRLMLTGQATLDVAIKAINEGAVMRFFTKPCNLVDLSFSIKHFLRQRQLMQAARRLLKRVRKQERILKRVQQQAPALSTVHKDSEGTILLDGTPADFDSFMDEVSRSLD